MRMLWKCLSPAMTSENNSFKWEMNKWYIAKDKMDAYNNDFYGCGDIEDSMRFIYPGYICLIEPGGKYIYQKSNGDKRKEYWEKVKIVRIYEWKNEDNIKLAFNVIDDLLLDFKYSFPFLYSSEFLCSYFVSRRYKKLKKIIESVRKSFSWNFDIDKNDDIKKAINDIIDLYCVGYRGHFIADMCNCIINIHDGYSAQQIIDGIINMPNRWIIGWYKYYVLKIVKDNWSK